MDVQFKETLKSQLLDEINRINRHVIALRAPVNAEERSVIARYGKLIFISQQLLQAIDGTTGRRELIFEEVQGERPVSGLTRGSSFSRQLGAS